MPCYQRIGWFLGDYGRLYAVALVLVYVQIGSGLMGSLGAQYTGVSVIDVVVSLFVLIATQHNSQHLSRIYAYLFGCTVFLDAAWFILFTHAIWNISSMKQGLFFIFSVRLTLLMQIIGSSVRLLSLFLWLQMYRLGSSSVGSSNVAEAGDDGDSFLNPSSSGTSVTSFRFPSPPRSIPDAAGDFPRGLFNHAIPSNSSQNPRSNLRRSIRDIISSFSLFDDSSEGSGHHSAPETLNIGDADASTSADRKGKAVIRITNDGPRVIGRTQSL